VRRRGRSAIEPPDIGTPGGLHFERHHQGW
jgi:hypothetical protein